MLSRILEASLLLALVLAATSALQGEDSTDVAVVVHPDVPVANLKFGEARRLLMGDRQYWSSNLRVTLLIQAPVARERNVILNRIYKMSEAQYRQYWIAKVFRGEVTSGPRIVYSNDKAIEIVAALPGAVGFIAASSVPEKVKVMKIDGLLPGEQGYPLR